MATAAGIASDLARRKCSWVNAWALLSPSERSPSTCCDATSGTHNHERRWEKPLKPTGSCLYRRVRDEQTVPAGKNVHQKLAVLCIKSYRGFRDATIGFAPLDLACEEET